jgi:hypothetical protein
MGEMDDLLQQTIHQEYLCLFQVLVEGIAALPDRSPVMPVAKETAKHVSYTVFANYILVSQLATSFQVMDDIRSGERTLFAIQGWRLLKSS